MKRTLIGLMLTTVVYAECPPEAIPGTCIEDPIVTEDIVRESCGCAENTTADLAEGVSAMANGDYATALRVFTILAKQGNFIAQQNLGVMYNEGLGVQKDKQKASYWFEKSKPEKRASASNENGSLCSGRESGMRSSCI